MSGIIVFIERPELISKVRLPDHRVASNFGDAVKSLLALLQEHSSHIDYSNLELKTLHLTPEEVLTVEKIIELYRYKQLYEQYEQVESKA